MNILVPSEVKPYRCSVPNCKGNNDTGPKVAVFGFPEETDLKKNGYIVLKEKILFHPKIAK